MDADRKRRLEELFDAAIDLSAAGRDAFLARECAGDPEMSGAVRRLLGAHERAEGILEARPAGLSDLLEDTAENAGPRRAGPYRLLEQIGKGGMGAVYLAERDDGQFRQRVAVKLIRPGFDTDDLGRRFLAERQILASLQHPHIAQLLDGGVTEDGRPYFVMEYVDGVALDVYFDRHRLTLEARLRLSATIACAVHYAHRNLVVHRDLKPSNILVTNEGVPKLLDFGIAKILEDEGAVDGGPLTLTGHHPMTPEYASPEQVVGGPITTATDVYGLGLILYEILTGRRPFEPLRRSAPDLERLIRETHPPRMTTAIRNERGPGGMEGRGRTAERIAQNRRTTRRRLFRDLTGDLERIVGAALRKEPERRYPSAEALATDIEAYLDGRPVWARGESTPYRVQRFVRRHSWGVAAVAAFVILLAGYAVTATMQSREIRIALDQTRVERDKAEGLSSFLMSLFQASDPAESRGDSITARELLQRGVERAELLDGEPLVQAEMLDMIGRVYTTLGQYETARPLLGRALASREREGGMESLEVAQSLDALAELLRQQGEYADAEEALRRALEIHQGFPGDNELEIAKRLHDLAVLLADRGDFAAAEALHLQALEVRRRLLGDQHLEIAESLGGLAFVALRTGDSAEARRLYEQSLAIRRRLLGDLHPDVALTMNNLGSTLLQLGDLEGSQRVHSEALAARRQLFGDDHPSVATSLNNLAQVNLLQGEATAADSLLREVLAMRRRLLGNEHPAVATALNNLAYVHYSRGDHTAAEPIYREVIDLQRRTLGERHPNTARALHNLALVLRATGRLGEAEAALREAASVREVVFAGDHPDRARGLHELGEVLGELGAVEEAEQVLRQAVEMRRRLLGDDHVQTVESTEALAGLRR